MDKNFNGLGDKRKYVRVLYTQEISCDTFILSNDEEPTILEKPFKFTTVDLSIRGMGVNCQYSIDVDTVIFFSFVIDNTKYNIKARITYCVYENGLYHMGLDFIYADEGFEPHVKRLVARLSLNNINKQN